MADLTASYARCRDLHRRHGRSYYLATRLLPAWKRRHVHALYGFTRHADEIVDHLDPETVPARERRLRDWGDRFLAGLAGEPIDDPLLPAVLHTVAVFNLDTGDFAAFLRSMAMDLTVNSYRTYRDLLSYMDGSAGAVGTLMLPILESPDPAAAREPARQLGIAFQLTNFIRDVAEDLARGRIYLPAEDLARFGVTPAMLRQSAARGAATPEVQQFIEYEVSRARGHYAAAAPGVDLLAPSSRACVRTAFDLYAAILDEIARAAHDPFRRRAVVSRRRRLAVAVRAGALRAVAGLT